MRLSLLFVLLTGLLCACQSAMVPESRAGAIPVACGSDFLRQTTTLTLPPAESAPIEPKKNMPLKFASEFPVGGGVRDIGRWAEASPGWSAWRLRLKSEGARSLSLHLRPFDLPEGGSLWVCAPNNQRQGPYTQLGPSGRGGLWTAGVIGPEIWLEVLVPEDSKDRVHLKIAEAFAGYR